MTPREEHVVIRYLDEPGLWSWEIRDAANGALVESSWTSAWTAFETRDAARAAGLERLAELVCGRERLDRGRAPASAWRIPA